LPVRYLWSSGEQAKEQSSGRPRDSSDQPDGRCISVAKLMLHSHILEEGHIWRHWDNDPQYKTTW
jgi:hypothetical protein